MHDRFRPPLRDERQQLMIILGDVEVAKANSLAGYLLPGLDTFSDGTDRRERRCLEFDVDFPTRQIVYDHHIVVSRRKMQDRGPAAKTVAAENQNFHLMPPRPK